jgi:para-nitrobenzyl esterase
MIYGQSGGGSKVTTLMGMPAAKGFFHRASAQSGGGGNIPSKEQQTEVARQLMKDLGLAPNDIASLQKMNWDELMAAGNAAVAKVNPPMRNGGGFPFGVARAGWSPCVDGKNITLRSFFDVAPEISKDVPMMVGSVSEEGNQMLSDPTEAEWQSDLAKIYGEHQRAQDGVSVEEDADAVVHVSQPLRIEHALHAQQRGEDGEIEV